MINKLSAAVYNNLNILDFVHVCSLDYISVKRSNKSELVFFLYNIFYDKKDMIAIKKNFL